MGGCPVVLRARVLREGVVRGVDGDE